MDKDFKKEKRAASKDVEDVKKKVASKMRGASNDKRYNAEKYTRGIKPSSNSEYFGKSYAELRRESKKLDSKVIR